MTEYHTNRTPWARDQLRIARVMNDVAVDRIHQASPPRLCGPAQHLHSGGSRNGVALLDRAIMAE